MKSDPSSSSSPTAHAMENEKESLGMTTAVTKSDVLNTTNEMVDPKCTSVSRSSKCLKKSLRSCSTRLPSPPSLLGRCASTPIASSSSNSSPSYSHVFVSPLSPLATSFSPSSSLSSSSLKKARSVSELDSGVATSLEETEWSASLHQGRLSIDTNSPLPERGNKTEQGCNAKPKKRWRRCRTRDLCVLSFTSSSSELLSSLSTSSLLPLSLMNPVGSFLKWEKVDVIQHCMEMALSHVISSILSRLSDADLINFMLVSTTWSVALATDQDANRRRIDFVAKRKRNIENNDDQCNDDDEGNNIGNIRRLRAVRSSPRRAMSNVSNLLSPKSSRKSATANDVVSPSKARHKLFTEEAAKLGPGERLCTCPRCASPSRLVPSSNTGNCGRASCGFVFCTKCLCEVHPHTPCRKTRSSGRSNANRVGSKASKLRLTRLLS